MRVKLIAATSDPIEVMWVAARTCYSEKSPIQIWYHYWEKEEEGQRDLKEKIDSREKQWKLVKQVLDSGHQSIAEHVTFTFAIEGISRACSHQLVRHRAGIVFSQQSQRYVEIKESKQELLGVLDRYNNAEMQEICDKYFVDFKDRINSDLIRVLCNYRDLIDGGCAPEDARNVLPNATKTNLVMSINLRELIHVSNLRLCTRAQLEIRDLFKAIKKCVVERESRFGDLLVPTCEAQGFCPEHKCCGRKPTKEEIIEGYERYKGLNK